jgi:hypothetical protein
MQRIICTAAIFSIAWFSCTGVDSSGNNPNTKVPADTASFTNIHWLDSILDFGTINKGEQVKIVYRFTNSGNHPLILSEVRPGCGCTAVLDFTKGAIAPGVNGFVTGLFDTNKSPAGDVRKTIFVTANTRNKNRHTLIFTGTIKETVTK